MKDLSADVNQEEWPLFFNQFFYQNDVDYSHRFQRRLFLQISHRISPTMTQVVRSPGLGNRWAKTQSKALTRLPLQEYKKVHHKTKLQLNQS